MPYPQLMRTRGKESREAIVLEQQPDAVYERFVVIADARFSALLVLPRVLGIQSPVAAILLFGHSSQTLSIRRLEYLMARVTADIHSTLRRLPVPFAYRCPKQHQLHLDAWGDNETRTLATGTTDAKCQSIE